MMYIKRLEQLLLLRGTQDTVAAVSTAAVHPLQCV